MATHRIILRTIGAGISSTLDLYRWDGVIWVSHIPNIQSSLFLSPGYEFTDDTGATQFKLVDEGACGTEKVFTMPTTTTAPTTTPAPTTTVPPTTAMPPTTTVAPTTTATPTYYTWYITAGLSGTCGDNVGTTPYYSNTNVGAEIVALWTDTFLLSPYDAGGTGLIAWSNVSGGLAQFRGALDTPTVISWIAAC